MKGHAECFQMVLGENRATIEKNGNERIHETHRGQRDFSWELRILIPGNSFSPDLPRNCDGDARYSPLRSLTHCY